ncbi:hypothetical protein DOCECA_04760 [Pseudomonas sp. E102]
MTSSGQQEINESFLSLTTYPRQLFSLTLNGIPIHLATANMLP